MKYIQSNNCKLEVGSIEKSSFNSILKETYTSSKCVIIVDENTKENCLEYLITSFEPLHGAEVIVLPVGEENKDLEIAVNVWEALTEYGITRYDLIINLGGGLVTDMGGFIASCYKRGCDYINIPTTLLGMVDASLGGKTGLNLGPYKNQIGVFSEPKVVYIDPIFLRTLPDVELRSGFAEMIKHGLIHSEQLFDKVIDAMHSSHKIDETLLVQCIRVKNKIVREDPKEDGKRKILNFGHTIGHAIEGYYMRSQGYTHGHCVAVGMIMEAYLSHKLGMLNEQSYLKIQSELSQLFEIPSFTDDEIFAIVKMLSNDKKNKGGAILCCLLEEIGTCKYDCVIEIGEFDQVFSYFRQLNS